MIDLPAAGKVLEQQIKARYHSATHWITSLGRDAPCTESTLRGIISGHYNQGAGSTLDMLWRICMALAEDDTNAAQALMLMYLQEAHVVPHESTMLVHVDLVRAEVHLKRCRQALEKLARKRQIEVVEPNGHEVT